ncbi:hypothetical protein NHX12_020068, partial [Muraenolepis orangiensis]
CVWCCTPTHGSRELLLLGAELKVVPFSSCSPCLHEDCMDLSPAYVIAAVHP